MIIRQANKSDISAITKLNRRAAETPNGVARTPAEIDEESVGIFVENALKKGLIFVAENPSNSQELIAEIHCWKHDPLCFKHVFGNLTIVVHPDFQGRGVGRKIFSHLLDEVRNNHPEIVRVELTVRQNNVGAQKLYKSLGFEIEGVMRKRILDADGKLGGDLMMGLVLSPESCLRLTAS